MSVATRASTTTMILRAFNCRLLPCSSSSSSSCQSSSLSLLTSSAALRSTRRQISFARIVCAAASSSDDKKVSSRLSQVQQLLQEAEDRASAGSNEPIPQITIDHVTVSFARSGGPGGQNVNKVNTKVDMRFNVKNAYWLSERVKEKILQTVCFCTPSLI
ncbi:Peptidyl-tRNA hydrolase ICT1, mitochondrial [Linum perenne]